MESKDASGEAAEKEFPLKPGTLRYSKTLALILILLLPVSFSKKYICRFAMSLYSPKNHRMAK